MPPLLFTLLYVFLSVVVGFAGSGRRCRFVGAFVLSLLFTPLVTFLVLYMTEPVKRTAAKAR